MKMNLEKYFEYLKKIANNSYIPEQIKEHGEIVIEGKFKYPERDSIIEFTKSSLEEIKNNLFLYKNYKVSTFIIEVNKFDTGQEFNIGVPKYLSFSLRENGKYISIKTDIRFSDPPNWLPWD